MGTFAGGSANVDNGDGGDVNNSGVSNGRGVRPVVSLRSDAISGGSGTMIDPYEVG